MHIIRMLAELAIAATACGNSTDNATPNATTAASGNPVTGSVAYTRAPDGSLLIGLFAQTPHR